MMGWVGILVLLLVAVLAVTFALAYGSHRWKAVSRSMRLRLEVGRVGSGTETYDPRELEGLPAPVERYFRAVLQEGQPVVLAVELEHTGWFNTSQTAANWRSFVSNQRVVIHRPGFDWEASIKIMPGLAKRIRDRYVAVNLAGPSVLVHDAYIAGEGILHASLFGLVTVAHQRGTPEIARGELMRFLAEAAWYPTALLPSQGARWEAVDEMSARVTLVDRDTAVSLVFRFGDDGLIESVHAEDRGRTVRGRIVPTRWEGKWRRYEKHHGMHIPLEGEVAWILPEGRRPYWRGRISTIRYEFARPHRALKARSEDRML